MRKYLSCIDMFALLYSKLSLDVEMVHRDLINQYNDGLKRKMNEKGKEYITVRTSFYDDPQTVFNCLNDTNGNCYSVLHPKYIYGENLEEIWEKHLKYQSTDLIAASIDSELLSILGISDSERILDFFSKMNFEISNQVETSISQKQKKPVFTKKPILPKHNN